MTVIVDQSLQAFAKATRNNVVSFAGGNGIVATSNAQLIKYPIDPKGQIVDYITAFTNKDPYANMVYSALKSPLNLEFINETQRTDIPAYTQPEMRVVDFDNPKSNLQDPIGSLINKLDQVLPTKQTGNKQGNTGPQLPEKQQWQIEAAAMNLSNIPAGDFDKDAAPFGNPNLAANPLDTQPAVNALVVSGDTYMRDILKRTGSEASLESSFAPTKRRRGVIAPETQSTSSSIVPDTEVSRKRKGSIVEDTSSKRQRMTVPNRKRKLSDDTTASVESIPKDDVMSEPIPKKTRRLTEKQLANLAKGRSALAEKRAAAKKLPLTPPPSQDRKGKRKADDSASSSSKKPRMTEPVSSSRKRKASFSSESSISKRQALTGDPEEEIDVVKVALDKEQPFTEMNDWFDLLDGSKEVELRRKVTQDPEGAMKVFARLYALQKTFAKRGEKGNAQLRRQMTQRVREAAPAKLKTRLARIREQVDARLK